MRLQVFLGIAALFVTWSSCITVKLIEEVIIKSDQGHEDEYDAQPNPFTGSNELKFFTGNYINVAFDSHYC